MLRVENLSVKIEDKEIVKDVSLELTEHHIFMVMGPNGAGKTTLFKAVMGIVAYTGEVFLNGKDIRYYRPRELARCIGVLTQKHQPQFAHSVYEVVSLGRYAYQNSIFGQLTKADRDKIEESLLLTGIEHLRDQNVLTLSGGELQRVFLAQLFAQDPKILILDEPTNHLDIQYQIAMFDIINNWVKQERRAVLAAVHDLNIVYSYGTRAMLMENGKVHAMGSPKEVLSRENLKAVYKVDVVQWMQNLLLNWNEN